MEQIETDRLMIRNFRPDDWKGLFDYLSNEAVVKYEPYGVFSEDACKQEAINRAANPDFRAVCLKENGRLIGNLYFARQQPAEFQTWELGYVFNADYQRNGYATESCRAIITRAFEHMNVRRIIAMCNPENVRSWKLLERLPMRREGRLLQEIYFKRDAQGKPLWQDTFIYAVLANEWKVNSR